MIESGIDGFICAWDDWIGWVLCPKDQYILKHLQNNGLVEVSCNFVIKLIKDESSHANCSCL